MAVTESPNLGLTWGWEEGESGWGGPVNFNWLILDVVTNALVLSATTKVPPADAVDGAAYIVPEDAEGAWESRKGMLACRITGDWHYFRPRKGWYFRVEDAGLSLMFDGQAWARYDGDKGDKGDKGDPPSLRRTATEIQWTVPGGNWATLIPLADLKGEPGDITPALLQLRNQTQAAADLAGEHLADAIEAKEAAQLAEQTAAQHAAQTTEDREAVALDRAVSEGSAIIAQQHREATEEAADIAIQKAGEIVDSANAAAQHASDAEQYKNDAQEAAGIAIEKAGIATQAAQDAEAAAEISQKGLAVTSETAPENPIPGQRWTDANSGRIFEWFEDEDSAQWIEVGFIPYAGFEILEARDTSVEARETTVQAAQVAEEAAQVAVKTVPIYSATPPEDPIAGAEWIDSETGKHYVWIDEGDGQWVELFAAEVVNNNIHIGPTPPDNPLPGAEWVDSETGMHYVWLDSGDGQWVEVFASEVIDNSIIHTNQLRDDLAADTGAELVAFKQAGAGAVARTLADKAREWVSVKDFGAVGDGVTDDTAAAQEAFDSSAGKEVVFPAGSEFLLGPLTINHPLSVRVDGILKYRDADGVFLTNTADNVTIHGFGVIDLNNTQNKGIYSTGNGFTIFGLTLKNMLGGEAVTGSSSALNVASCESVRVHNLRFKNIQKGNAPAPFVSQPRACSFDSVKNMMVSDIVFEDVYVIAGVGAVEDSVFSNITVVNSDIIEVDNGFYIIGSTRCLFNNVVVRGWKGEPVVFSGCENIVFNGGEIVDWSDNSCGIENSNNIEFNGTRFTSRRMSTILKSRSANTDGSAGITLRNLLVKVKGDGDILGFYNGAVNDLIIQGCVFEAEVDAEAHLNQRFIHLTSTDSFVINDNTFILREESPGDAAAEDWTVTLTASTYSDFKRNTFINRTINGRFRIFGTDNPLISSDGLHNQANISGSRNPNYGLTTAEPREFYGISIPSSGSFIRGDKIWNTSASAAGPHGWVCVVEGSPGTWAAIGGHFVAGTKIYNPPSLNGGESVVTDVSVPGAEVGDIALASFGVDLQGVQLSAYVSATNTVNVIFYNSTGSTVDVAQSTIRVKVIKV